LKNRQIPICRDDKKRGLTKKNRQPSKFALEEAKKRASGIASQSQICLWAMKKIFSEFM